jgi:hypothetical protein
MYRTQRKSKGVAYLDVNPFLLLEFLVLAHQTLFRTDRRHDGTVNVLVVKTDVLCLLDLKIGPVGLQGVSGRAARVTVPDT